MWGNVFILNEEAYSLSLQVFATKKNDSSSTHDFVIEKRPTTTHTSAHEFFSSQGTHWSKASRTYYTREDNQAGEGKKALVYISLVDSRRKTGFDCITDEEMHHHLHITNIHHGITQQKSKDVCKLTSNIVDQGRSNLAACNNAMKMAFNESILHFLKRDGSRSDTEIHSIMTMMNKEVDEKMDEQYAMLERQQKIAHPTTYNEIRNSYTEGQKSILKNLPMPNVHVDDDCAYIPATEIIDHMLALGLDVVFLRAGYEQDWMINGTYECNFIEEMHKQVEKEMLSNPALTHNTRVIIVRIWSDGFEAHHILTNTDYNSLQLFTLTLRAPKGKRTKHHTLPFALCFKKNHSHNIFIQLLKEVNDLQKPTPRYWGKEKQVHNTMVFLDMVSNDLPERCFNTGTSLIGTFTHRWRHSCKYDDNWTPSCNECLLDRMDTVLTGKDNKPDKAAAAMKPSCNKCSDWWSSERKHVYTTANVYPLGPGENSNEPIPAVELSFELMENSLNKLQHWYQQSINEKSSKKSDNQKLKKTAEEYMHRVGVSSQLVPLLLKDLQNGLPMKESVYYPKILKLHKTLNIKLKKFESMIMHMCNLGVEKSLIAKSPMIVNRKMKAHNEFWYNITSSIQSSQKRINSISVNWCKSMPFSGKDKQSLGTSSWQSDHYLAFTRLSLFHFAPLDAPDTPKDIVRVIAAFKRVRVLWFCLMASIFCEETVPSSRIDNYVKLFLSSCRILNIAFSVNETDGKQKEKKGKGMNARKTKAPFFTSGSNYLSLLNLENMIQDSGDLKETYEGLDEGYIQMLKRELPTMRHTTEFLATVLRKLLVTGFFSLLNKDNPNGQQTEYNRNYNIKIYRIRAQDALSEGNEALVGGVDKNGNMFLCLKDNAGIGLHPLRFDDKDGFSCLELWYAKVSLGPVMQRCQKRKELDDICHDYFIMLPRGIQGPTHAENITLRTIICRSWRIRDCNGKLRLPVPSRSILEYDIV